VGSPPKSPVTALVIFAKAPVVGTVKTRMQPPLSDLECLILHNALLRHTLAKLGPQENADVAKVLYLTGSLADAHRHSLGFALTPDVQVETQLGRDLGERLVNALARKFDEGFKKVIFIGTDTPLLSAREIGYAIDELSHCDVVIGPAADGGYYLIGFSARIPAVLKGIDWGSPRVYLQTLDLMRLHGVRWKSLAIRSDVDTFEDLRQLRQAMEDSPSLAAGNEGNELYVVLNDLLARHG
jgi:uncharacterized protein